MNETEIARIAAATNALRPDWPIASLTTLLRDKLATRARRDVAVALAWIACESDTMTPARVLEAGPWWMASPDSGPTKREPYDENTTCAVCSLPTQARCEARWSDDHEFVSVARNRTYRSGAPLRQRAPWISEGPMSREETDTKAREFESRKDSEREANRPAVMARIAEIKAQLATSAAGLCAHGVQVERCAEHKAARSTVQTATTDEKESA